MNYVPRLRRWLQPAEAVRLIKRPSWELCRREISRALGAYLPAAMLFGRLNPRRAGGSRYVVEPRNRAHPDPAHLPPLLPELSSRSKHGKMLRHSLAKTKTEIGGKLFGADDPTQGS